MRSTHLKRTDDLVRRVISEALVTKVQDPRIGVLSVTGVRVSPEFDTARVYVSILGDEAAREESLEGLKSAASFLQSELAREIRLRRIPRLRFFHDDSIEHGNRVDQVLDDLARERKASNEDGDDAARDR